jgi:ribosome-associated toxin RatA of RatAB toxin-antitoxin module
MTSIHRSALVPYSTEKMYGLINDVNTYPEFLPWCSHARVLEKNDTGMLASITVSGGGLNKTFTTKNTFSPYHCITMAHVDGPFKALAGTWRLTALADLGCRVELDLTFEVHSGLKAMLFGLMFNKAADKLVEGFTARAHHLFGGEK